MFNTILVSTIRQKRIRENYRVGKKMSNILKVTTPALGYENAVNKQNINQPENLGIQAPVRADNAAGAGNKEEFSGMKDGSGIYQESNFANFIRTL